MEATRWLGMSRGSVSAGNSVITAVHWLSVYKNGKLASCQAEKVKPKLKIIAKADKGKGGLSQKHYLMKKPYLPAWLM